MRIGHSNLGKKEGRNPVKQNLKCIIVSNVRIINNERNDCKQDVRFSVQSDLLLSRLRLHKHHKHRFPIYMSGKGSAIPRMPHRKHSVREKREPTASTLSV